MCLSTPNGNLECVPTAHFSDILMVMKDPRLKSCEAIYARDFSLSLDILG